MGVSHGSTNTSIQVAVRQAGQVVLKMWDNNDSLIRDYLRIAAGPVIHPDKVCFCFYVCFVIDKGSAFIILYKVCITGITLK